MCCGTVQYFYHSNVTDENDTTVPPSYSTYMVTAVAVPVDTTCDGRVNAMGCDTTGDGIIDSLNINGDGRIDTTVPANSNYAPPPTAQAYVSMPVPVPVDTTGDGKANVMGYDTSGDGKLTR
jgi:hypothetical protein